MVRGANPVISIKILRSRSEHQRRIWSHQATGATIGRLSAMGGPVARDRAWPRPP